MNNPTVRRVLVVTTVVGATLGGGIAVAAWTSTGSGTAGAKAGTAAAPATGTVDASALTTGLLYPGGTGDAKLLVHNPNPYPVAVTRVAAGTGAPTGSGGAGTCTATGVSWILQTPPANTVPAGGTATLTLPGAVAMSTSSDDGCQGAVFTVPVTVTVSS
ncbi:hypothetical protein ABJI51_13805 [Amycolatopsis sp. NEAU-NG30]|uniref:Uncharacterized protein n=1 Tax=Amycolatopsis melonis TaxID=3156488 RepID=A0ABV0LCX3_9PSEU